MEEKAREARREKALKSGKEREVRKLIEASGVVVEDDGRVDSDKARKALEGKIVQLNTMKQEMIEEKKKSETLENERRKLEGKVTKLGLGAEGMERRLKEAQRKATESEAKLRSNSNKDNNDKNSVQELEKTLQEERNGRSKLLADMERTQKLYDIASKELSLKSKPVSQVVSGSLLNGEMVLEAIKVTLVERSGKENAARGLGNLLRAGMGLEEVLGDLGLLSLTIFRGGGWDEKKVWGVFWHEFSDLIDGKRVEEVAELFGCGGGGGGRGGGRGGLPPPVPPEVQVQQLVKKSNSPVSPRRAPPMAPTAQAGPEKEKVQEQVQEQEQEQVQEQEQEMKQGNVIKEVEEEVVEEVLPEDWEKRTRSSDGKIYFVNHKTRKTQWKKPMKKVVENM